LPQQKIWNEVSRSNLSKISPNGKVIKREDGKVLKPEGWSPPNIKEILEKQ
jgi:predicted HAD superfamily Cof-like phosphohydrolase